MAHTQEKYRFVKEEKENKEKELNKITGTVLGQKEELKKKKLKHETKSLKNYNEKKRIDDINSVSLIKYYRESHNNIRDYYMRIQEVVSNIEKLRDPTNIKDINMLKKRAEKLYYEEYNKLIVFEENEKQQNN